MATVWQVNKYDLNCQFFVDLGKKLSAATEIKIRIPDAEIKAYGKLYGPKPKGNPRF